MSAKPLEVMRKLMLMNQSISSDLWTTFAEITAFIQQEAFWIIDGLDESSESSPELIKLIISQLHIHKSSRVALLRRPSSFLPEQSSAVMEIKPEITADDISRYIEDEVQKSENLNS
jgi:hypothetical protein